MKVNCTNCEKTLYRRPSKVASQKHFFCSMECRSAYRKSHPDETFVPPAKHGEDNPFWSGGKEVRQCDNCSHDIERHPSEFANKKNVFCSPKCQGEWIKKYEAKKSHHNWKGHTITCAYCGATQQRSPSLIKGRHQFCDNQCRGLWLAQQAHTSYRKDANHDSIVHALEERGCYVIDTHTIGSGFPDLVVGFNGKIYLLEIKNPLSSHGVTKAQEKWIARANHAGVTVHIVNSIDKALQTIGAI